MESFKIIGGKPLDGKVRVDSAKNSILPIIAGCVMSEEEIIIRDSPKLYDVVKMVGIINKLG